MKQYKDYMDGIEAPERLHKRLTELQPPPAKRHTWQVWGGMAAAAMLILAVSSTGLWQGQGRPTPTLPVPAVTNQPDSIIEPQGSAAPVETAPLQTAGPLPVPMPEPEPEPEPGAPEENSYLAVENGAVYLYYIPKLAFANNSEEQPMADYSLEAPGGSKRKLDDTDLICLTGGETALRDHLLWDCFNIQGNLYFNQQQEFHAGELYGTGELSGEQVEIILEMLKGGPVPFCPIIKPEEIGTIQWKGISVSGKVTEQWVWNDKTMNGATSFFEASGYGWKCTVYAETVETLQMLQGRFVNWAAEGLFCPDSLSPESSSKDAIPADNVRPQDGMLVEPGSAETENSEFPAIPDRETPPDTMPTAHIIHPGEPGYVDPLDPPVPPEAGDAGTGAEGQ